MNKVATWLVKIIDKALPPETDIFPKQLVEYQGASSETNMLFPYGMYANVSNDVLALMFFYAGNSENRLAIPGSFEVRPTLEQGEVAIYRPDGDALIKFTNAGDIEISTSANVTVSCVDAEGTASGNVVATCVDITVTNTGAATVNSTGDITLNSGGNILLDADGDITLDAGSNVVLNATSALDFDGASATFDTSGALTITASGVLDLNGSAINLN